MISSEVQRTLVKSPPELWAELSDPAGLARHLGELGEIRIVRTEPERTVEWSAENTTGIVSIKPSGWGTKVTLSVTRETLEEGSAAAIELDSGPELPRADAPGPEQAPLSDSDAVATPELPVSAESAAAHAVDPHPGSSAALAAALPALAASPEIDPDPATAPQPAPRRGFFARLFGRRRAPAATLSATRVPGEPDAFAAVSRALEPHALVREHPFAAPTAACDSGVAVNEPGAAVGQPDAEQPERPDHAERTDRISAELIAAEAVPAEHVSAEEVTAVLTAVLDRLGAAHHRPFSRS